MDGGATHAFTRGTKEELAKSSPFTPSALRRCSGCRGALLSLQRPLHGSVKSWRRSGCPVMDKEGCVYFMSWRRRSSTRPSVGLHEGPRKDMEVLQWSVAMEQAQEEAD